MKKIYIIIAGLVLASIPSVAQTTQWSRKGAPVKAQAPEKADANSLIFGYCQGFDEGIGTGGASTLSAAIEIPAAIAEKWIGDEITSVRIALGNANKPSAKLFITNKLSGTPAYTQNINFQTQNGWNDIDLTTPYVIDGKPFFVGYEINAGSTDYPIGIDGKATDSTLGDYLAINGNWEHYGYMFGNICIQLVINGPNLSANDIYIDNISVPSFTKPNTPFSATIQFINAGTDPVTDVEVAGKVAGADQDNLVALLSPKSIVSGGTGTITVHNLQTPVEESDVEVDIEVIKVNNSPDEDTSDNNAVTYIASFSKSFDRKVVIEEWTGTWCQWCPRGIVGMQYMEDTYGDDGFIGIAVHSGDAMEVASYAPFLNKYSVVGFPGAVVNRMVSTDPSQTNLEKYYRQFKAQQSFMEVTGLTAEFNATNPNLLEVKASVNSSVPVNGDYRLAFVITENNVGPYPQQNAYSGGRNGVMGGWESKASSVSTRFNEVARIISSAFGDANSLPSEMAAGQAYDFSTSLQLTKVRDIEQCALVAMVLNTRNNEVINATKISLAEDSAVDSIADENEIAIDIVGGRLSLNGEIARCEVYGIDGASVFAGAEAGNILLDGGIYIVKVTLLNGNVITRKVFVK